MAADWNALDAKGKEEYVQLAEDDKARYTRELEEYKWLGSAENPLRETLTYPPKSYDFMVAHKNSKKLERADDKKRRTAAKEQGAAGEAGQGEGETQGEARRGPRRGEACAQEARLNGDGDGGVGLEEAQRARTEGVHSVPVRPADLQVHGEEGRARRDGLAALGRRIGNRRVELVRGGGGRRIPRQRQQGSEEQEHAGERRARGKSDSRAWDPAEAFLEPDLPLDDEGDEEEDDDEEEGDDEEDDDDDDDDDEEEDNRREELLERADAVGGVWYAQANLSSRVNTSEAAYRLAERAGAINFDHTPTSQIMGDLAFLASTYLAQRSKLSVTVTGVRSIRKLQHTLYYSSDRVRNFDITTTAEEAIRCDIILKCTGYWKNEAVKKLLGSSSIYPNNSVRDNLIFQAEAILDDPGGFQTPFGSSYVEAAAFSVLVFASDTKYDNVSKLDLVDAPVSQMTSQLMRTLKASSALAAAAYRRVIHRSLNYHERFLPEQFQAENAREWKHLSALSWAVGPPLNDLSDGYTRRSSKRVLKEQRPRQEQIMGTSSTPSWHPLCSSSMPAAIGTLRGLQTLQFAVLTTPTHVPRARWDTNQSSNNVSADYGSFVLVGILIDDGIDVAVYVGMLTQPVEGIVRSNSEYAPTFANVSSGLAHGTGTALGDPIEVGAAIGSFPEAMAIESSSLKGNMGHLESAASGGGILSSFSTSLGISLAAPNCQLRVFNPHLASLLKRANFSMPVEDLILIQCGDCATVRALSHGSGSLIHNFCWRSIRNTQLGFEYLGDSCDWHARCRNERATSRVRGTSLV
ncbi:hypothetical protein AURANDRAFT_67303 [Aureococcus anophagefferens]|uniref:HMG box domain-containing protein n=1 Tax=Aureococcus anophagefferens TaxID=44056 RepID=F0YKP9_AURAN|nr:hypothetical protein AURANDRAFT_67303 [Aureococcus anophagefferens]EGB04271.1 hypothetical protein AURANDRAFT_67303 [Aureococcus anophagefferens]|eukprot:XP_009040981.1 hypothetical protein AURANDRAFT_67303 [Aureococcus anophagefferens]